MTTHDHLNRIAAKCREKIDLCERNCFQSGCEEAAWRATIAAIEALDDVDEALGCRAVANAIIAAWPEDLL